jgi:hypothetical protein
MKALIHDPREWLVGRKMFKHLRFAYCLALLALMAAAPAMRAAGGEDDEFDSYKVRLDGFWFYSKPTGHFSSKGNLGLLDLERDIGFKSYSTGAVKIDWKFTHKNHLYFIYDNFTHTKSTVLNRTVVFQGQTFNIGTSASGSLSSKIYIPGYQYDFIRRKRGSLGVQVQLNIIDVVGKLSAAAQVNNGVPQTANFSSSDLRVPLPVAGPTTRIYLIPDSGRLFLDANVLGMYFFGYGNYVSTMGTLGFTVVKHVAIRGGYSLGSRFDIKTKTDRVGVTLSQHGALVGLELSF